MKFLCQNLQYNTITSIDLTSNEIEDIGAQCLADTLKLNKVTLIYEIVDRI